MKQRGVSLLEVLVSLVILSTGTLGVLGMQTYNLKTSQENAAFNQANLLAQDMFHRIMANADHATAENQDYSFEFTTPLPRVIYDCNLQSCSQSEMAQWDVSEWRTMVANARFLPEGKAQVDVTTDASGLFAQVSITLRFANLAQSDSVSIANAGEDERYFEQFVFKRNI